LRSTILNKKEKLKKNQSQLEAKTKYDDLLQKMISEKETETEKVSIDAENEEKEENREIKLLEEEERLKSEMMNFEKQIDKQEENDLIMFDQTKDDLGLSETMTIASNETGKKERAKNVIKY
jgi:hypothetical protein